MRKLFLTSFTFKTGDNEFTQQRLVAINSNDKDEEADLTQAYETAKSWFPHEFPESNLLSLVAYPAITEAYLNKPLSQLAQGTFNIAHGPNETPYLTVDDFSNDVLIDIDGTKKTFRVGYLNIDQESGAREWIIYDKDETIDIINMRWQYLPS